MVLLHDSETTKSVHTDISTELSIQEYTRDWQLSENRGRTRRYDWTYTSKGKSSISRLNRVTEKTRILDESTKDSSAVMRNPQMDFSSAPRTVGPKRFPTSPLPRLKTLRDTSAVSEDVDQSAYAQSVAQGPHPQRLSQVFPRNTDVPRTLITSSVSLEQDCPPSFLNQVGATTTAVSTLSVSPVEAIIIISFFALWFFAIILFIRKWHHLKLIEPREHSMRQKPKNLESVKIVKRSSDSVIYNAYPLAMTRTMALREKRLARMQTMPAIKLNPEEKSPVTSVKRDLDIAHKQPVPLLFVPKSKDGSDEEEDFCYGSPQEHYPMLALQKQ